MPQLDQQSFFAQSFYFILIFYTLYFVIISYFLPLIFFILKFRVHKFSDLINLIGVLHHAAIRYRIFHIVNYDNFKRDVFPRLEKEQLFFKKLESTYSNIFLVNRNMISIVYNNYYTFLKQSNFRILLVKKDN